MSASNVTLSLPENLVQRAQVLAARRGVSMPALVAELLGARLDELIPDDDVWTADEGTATSAEETS